MLKQKLIELRQKTGLSQVDFAKKVGCSSKHISQMELGKSQVSFKTLNKYASIFNLDLIVEFRSV